MPARSHLVLLTVSQNCCLLDRPWQDFTSHVQLGWKRGTPPAVPLALVIKPCQDLCLTCYVCCVFASYPDGCVTPITVVPFLPQTCCLTLKNLWMMSAIWKQIFSSSPHLVVKIQLHPAPSADAKCLSKQVIKYFVCLDFFQHRDTTFKQGDFDF